MLNEHGGGMGSEALEENSNTEEKIETHINVNKYKNV